VYNRFTPARILNASIDAAKRATAIALPGLYGGERFTCPICEFSGPFVDLKIRAFARCPKCGALERHRLQKLVLDRLAAEKQPVDLSTSRCLQFAPDPVTPILRRYCREVVTADINPKAGSIKLDMCNMALPDASFDVVFASHVLEHIQTDRAALEEIRRILRPGGVAILPVPVIVEKTVEYGGARPHEDYHVRAVGEDYFDRYREVFGNVRLVKSGDFPDRFQTWIFDTVQNQKVADTVPICVKSGSASEGSPVGASSSDV